MASREIILKKLRDTRKLSNRESETKPNWVEPIYHKAPEDLTSWFRDNIELVGGIVYEVDNIDKAAAQVKALKDSSNWEHIYCSNTSLYKSLSPVLDIKNTEDEFLNTEVGITTCEYLVAHLGSVLVSSQCESGRRLHVYPETHIVIAHTDQVKAYLEDALYALDNKYPIFPSQISNITGPSRTADIEKTLVMGMHGPKKLIVIISKEPF